MEHCHGLHQLRILAVLNSPHPLLLYGQFLQCSDTVAVGWVTGRTSGLYNNKKNVLHSHLEIPKCSWSTCGDWA